MPNAPHDRNSVQFSLFNKRVLNAYRDFKSKTFSGRRANGSLLRKVPERMASNLKKTRKHSIFCYRAMQIGQRIH